MKLSRQFPLNALRVFEVVARLGSFTKAGAELGMTQTAVSYQIKLLEERTAETLFLRLPRQIALTEAGQRLAPKVTEAFEMLAEAMASLRKAGEETLTIHSTATFAHRWLSRYIGAFQLDHPNIAVRLVTSSTLIDFHSEAADVAIRWGKGDWPGLVSHRIMRLDFSPMLSPRLAEDVGGILEPADLLKLTVISAGDPLWRNWFLAAGIEAPGLDRFPKNEFGTQMLDAAIAMAGDGVAILNPGHFVDDVAAGRLYQPFPLTYNDGQDYWFAYPQNRRNVPKIRNFRDWLLRRLNVEQP